MYCSEDVRVWKSRDAFIARALAARSTCAPCCCRDLLKSVALTYSVCSRVGSLAYVWPLLVICTCPVKFAAAVKVVSMCYMHLLYSVFSFLILRATNRVCRSPVLLSARGFLHTSMCQALACCRFFWWRMWILESCVVFLDQFPRLSNESEIRYLSVECFVW